MAKQDLKHPTPKLQGYLTHEVAGETPTPRSLGIQLLQDPTRKVGSHERGTPVLAGELVSAVEQTWNEPASHGQILAYPPRREL